MNRQLPLTFSLLAAGVAASAQELPPVPTARTFDVASIKPSSPDGGTETRRYPGGRFTASGVTLKALIQRAWNVKSFQVVGGPAWVNSQRYDVNAKAALDGNLSGDQLMPLIQALLVERFHLRIHRETRELPIYSLVLGKSGAKLQPTTTATGPTWSKTSGLLTGQKISMEMFATDLLEPQLDRVVTDHTGIKGEFDVRLTWTPVDIDANDADSPLPANPDGPSLFTAIQEQLGLKLEATKGPVEVLVIESVEKPSGN
jgi:bla regulator protein BlaR1